MLGSGVKKLMRSEPESFIGVSTSPAGRLAGNILTGKFGEDEMLAAPDIEDEALQQALRADRHGQGQDLRREQAR